MSIGPQAMLIRPQAMLIRPQAWWMNKVPLSVLLVSLLLASGPLTRHGLESLVLVVVIVSCLANYGYGLNELFDRAEDARAGRDNVAQQRGSARVWFATAVSALLAICLASYGAGLVCVLATLLELVLPATYSVPPIRTKERRWLAVLSDATAAHVYPAVLALLVLQRHGDRSFSSALVTVVVVWAAATGLRGILSHLVWSREHDRSAGLQTVAHSSGGRRLPAFILVVLLPVEVVSFGLLLVLSKPGLPMAVVCAVFLCNELRRALSPTVRAAFAVGYEGRVFAAISDRYVPFVDEKFYKLWGPILVPVAAAAATRSPWFFVISAAYVLLFWSRVRTVSWRTV